MLENESSKSIDLSELEVSLKELDFSKATYLSDTTLLCDVLNNLQQHKIGSVVLTNNEMISGIITERDFLFKLWGTPNIDLKKVSALEVMTKNPLTLNEESLVSDVIKIMGRRAIRHLPIINDSMFPERIVSIKDIFRFLDSQFNNEIGKHGTLFDWAETDILTQSEDFSFTETASTSGKKLSSSIFLNPIWKVIGDNNLKIDMNEDIRVLIEKMKESRSGSAIVTSYETIVKGIITERDFLLKIFGVVDLNQKGPLLVKDFMTPSPHCLGSSHIIAYGINNMLDKNYRNIIIIDEEKIPIGLVTLQKIMHFLADKIFPLSVGPI